MKRCIIIGAGSFYGRFPKLKETDYIIAADGGYKYCKAYGIKPDLVIGDFDSLKKAPADCPFERLPVEKNDTDTLAAIRLGLEKGFNTFRIIAGTGGRFDHTLANMQCLTLLSKSGKTGFLYGRNTIITSVTDGSIFFGENASGTVSVFSAGDAAEGVTETGLKYSLNNAVLTNDFPIGVSNSFTGVKSKISVRKGSLYVVFPICASCRILFNKKSMKTGEK